jgi:hypothetical protein
MQDPNDGMSQAFHDWQRLTDAYAIQLEALHRMVPGASDRLDRIRVRLAEYSSAFGVLTPLH